MGGNTTLAQLVRLHEDIAQGQHHFHPAVRAAVKVIHAADVFPSASEVAVGIPYAPRTLCRYFGGSIRSCSTNAPAGLTVERYIIGYRILRALEHLVADPYVDLEIVAERVGYASLSPLCRAWRREVGMTPGVAARLLRLQGSFPPGGDELLSAANLLDLLECTDEECGGEW